MVVLYLRMLSNRFHSYRPNRVIARDVALQMSSGVLFACFNIRFRLIIPIVCTNECVEEITQSLSDVRKLTLKLYPAQSMYAFG